MATAHTKPRLAIIGTVGLPAQYGGFETLVEQLIPYLEEDFSVTVYCSSTFYDKKDRKKYYRKTRLRYIPFSANGIGSIPYDILSIVHAAFTADVFLILGVSGAIILPFVKFFTKKKTYVNIDGIEWKRDKWNKFIKTFLRYSEIFAVESAEGIITDNQVIHDYMKMSYNYDSYLIEYGGDQATIQRPSKVILREFPFLKAPYAFSVCRIEPENNIHIILEAMAVQSTLPLVLVGNWNKSLYGEKLREQYNSFKHLHLLDPIYEPIKLNTLRSNCYIYLHGHSAGGTNPSLVEAMNLSLPIIAFDVIYNRETTENEALYFSDVNDLETIIVDLNEELLERLSLRMKAIAQRRYTWKVIADKYLRMMLPKHLLAKKQQMVKPVNQSLEVIE